MTPAEYCRDRAAKSGSSFYYSFRFLPPARRDAITALYAFCREVDDAADEVADPTIAAVKLAWWRGEVKRIFEGAPEHPVGQALAPIVRDFDLPREHFEEIIDGMEMDLTRDRYASFADLSLYCYRVASVVGLLSATIFGFQDRKTLRYAHDLGMAFQLTNIIRDVGEDARRGRIYLPQDELRRFDVAEADLLACRESEALGRLLEFQVQRARGYYEQALAALPAQDRKAQRAGLCMAAIYRTLLEEMAPEGAKLINRRISLTPIRKLWIAWKTWNFA